MKFTDQHGAGWGVVIKSKDQEFASILSMVVICIAVGILVVIVAVGLGVASFWVKRIQSWPISEVSIGTLAMLWLWCMVIYPFKVWCRHTR